MAQGPSQQVLDGLNLIVLSITFDPLLDSLVLRDDIKLLVLDALDRVGIKSEKVNL